MAKYAHRQLEKQVAAAARGFPALVLTGPRRSGKTTLLRRLFPAATYVLAEDPDVVARLRADPQGFLDAIKTPAILDEVQNVPEVFAFVRARIDRAPRKLGQWLLTGSQEAPLMRNVSESMAGRAAILQLLPLSAAESDKVSPFRGGYPEVLARPSAARLWFSSYVQTYLERDVRQVLNVHDLSVFRRFMALVASRHGQVLNKTDLAAPLGVSIPTITQWLAVLETTLQIALVPPYFENLGKRLIKSPKLYLLDSGLVCHLLGIESNAELQRSVLGGAVFEGFIASEIIKSQLHAGRRRELYYFRDQQGLEVDFVVPGKSGAVHLIEAKAGATVRPEMAAPMLKLAQAFRRRPRPARVDMTIVHGVSTHASHALASVAKGVRAEAWPSWARGL
ncbi:MAG TPA: ATP-binding protein [Polyangiales bacterium]